MYVLYVHILMSLFVGLGHRNPGHFLRAEADHHLPAWPHTLLIIFFFDSVTKDRPKKRN